jgi:hypothetical protein
MPIRTAGTFALTTSMLDDQHRSLLRAVTGRGDAALAAFRLWREATVLDDIDYATFRVMPLVVEAARHHGIDDPDLGRMKGIARYVWTSNLMRLRELFTALRVLQGTGIQPVLLKGAALLTRFPDLSSKRPTADYDVLLPAGTLARAWDVLKEQGFTQLGASWDNFDHALPHSGAPITVHGKGHEVDLHWRPVSSIRDEALTHRTFALAENAVLQGEPVLIPSVAHQLFFAMARCERSDQSECFTRLMEGYFLLSKATDADWDEVAALVARYGLEAPAYDYLNALATDAGVSVPAATLSRIKRGLTVAKRREWTIRAVPESRRNPLQRWFLNRQDTRHTRTTDQYPGAAASALMQACVWPALLPAIWRLARRRFHGPSTGKPRFLYGFSFPELTARWTDGHWAFMTLPLTDAQRVGETIRLNATVYHPNRRGLRMYAFAGDDLCRIGVLADGAIATDFRAVPQPQLGGDALLMLWLPDARSPQENGVQADARVLGLYIDRDWWR